MNSLAYFVTLEGLERFLSRVGCALQTNGRAGTRRGETGHTSNLLAGTDGRLSRRILGSECVFRGEGAGYLSRLTRKS